MATITVGLTEADILDAIDLWVRAQGLVPKGRGSVTIVPADRPHESPTCEASIEAEMLPAPNPQR